MLAKVSPFTVTPGLLTKLPSDSTSHPVKGGCSNRESRLLKATFPSAKIFDPSTTVQKFSIDIWTKLSPFSCFHLGNPFFDRTSSLYTPFR